jgi:hypothetical protein
MSTTKTSLKTTQLDSESGLFQKVLAVQKAITAVPKRGYNSFHKYHYATEADILSIKETLNDHGLVILPTTLHQETGFKPDGKSWASVTLLFRVVDADSGESIDSQFTGYAEDNFDKAIYKATTGANKYFYLKFFGIATEDDPEREEALSPPGRPYAAGQPNTASLPVKSFKTAPKATQPEPIERRAAGPAPASTHLPNNQALVMANKILALQKQAGLSNEEVLLYGEIDSIKGLAEEGDTEQLAAAYSRLVNQIKPQKVM